MLGQIEVLRKEADEFMRGSVICKLVWLGALILEHYIEQLATVSTSLYWAVYIEIEDTQRFHLNNIAGSIAYEELLKAYLEETDTFVRFRPYEDNVTVCT